MKKISAVIPAYNEEKRIKNIINRTRNFVDEIIVVDDFSTDDTGDIARKAGAKVLSNTMNKGYIESIKKGFRNAKGDIIVTLDADGEHNPEDILQLLEPILDGKSDLVLGKREKIVRISERFLNWLTHIKIKVKDSGTGFRAIKKELALQLRLKGKCPCGVFVLESAFNGVEILEVPITLNYINKNRRIAWCHFLQFFYILKWLIKRNKNKIFYKQYRQNE